jgi:hypothetical protein
MTTEVLVVVPSAVEANFEPCQPNVTRRELLKPARYFHRDLVFRQVSARWEGVVIVDEN